MDIRHIPVTTRAGLEVLMTPFTPDDVARVHAICQDPEIQRWTTVPSPYPLSAAESYVGTMAPAAWPEIEAGTFSVAAPGPELIWSVRLADGDAQGAAPASGALVGSTGLKRLGDHVTEIGWWLAPEARGQGIMRAVVAKLTELSFTPGTPFQARRVVWHAAVGNIGSARIAMRCGYRYQGELDHYPGCGRAWEAVIDAGEPVAPRTDWPALAAA